MNKYVPVSIHSCLVLSWTDFITGAKDFIPGQKPRGLGPELVKLAHLMLQWFLFGLCTVFAGFNYSFHRMIATLIGGINRNIQKHLCETDFIGFIGSVGGVTLNTTLFLFGFMTVHHPIIVKSINQSRHFERASLYKISRWRARQRMDEIKKKIK